MFGKITLAMANENMVGRLTKLETAPLSNPYKNIDIGLVKLNESKFTKEMLDENDYDIEVSRTESNGYNIEASLNKNLNFIFIFLE